MEFGENVLYLKPKSVGKETFWSRWVGGAWLGIRDETIIGRDEGVIEVRTVGRMRSSGERGNADTTKKMQGVPWEPVSGGEGIDELK